jgi:LacI family transcriptional regulator
MTIKDLAAKTGYAVATVSRVLNNHPNVSEKARQVIMAEVNRSGFQLNVNAKQLKQQHATTILVVVKGTANELFSELLESIQSQIARTRYPMAVDYLDEDRNEVLRAVQLCREKKPLGILFLGGNTHNFEADFDKIDVPCVVVTNDMSSMSYPNLSSISVDGKQACRKAVNSLIDQGHRNIVVVGGERVLSDTGRQRFEGCLEAMRERDVAFDEELDYRGVRFSYQDGYDATKSLLEDGREFTALFAAADVMAIGAIRALRDAGKRVPEDVSVVGFDGLPLGSFLVPQLTTIVQPVQQMAQRSVEMLISSIEEGGEARHETVPFSLCSRESTRKI